jgi:DNA-directed RNA polymerase subunit omega
MARVTVEDCTQVIKNRFELVVLCSRRARDISSGAEINIERDNDKNAVVALREIAEKKIDKDQLNEEVISGYQDVKEYVATETKLEKVEVEASDDKTTSSKSNSKNTNMFAEDNIHIED